MHTKIVMAVLLLLSHLSYSQIRLDGYRQGLIDDRIMDLTTRWKARWISVPGEPRNQYGVYHMRRTFNLGHVPDRFVVHVTADNRYKLYVNGKLVSLGPSRGDIYNWNFETLDLAPFLKTGKNVLAAVVWNYAEHRPVAQISFNKTGFLLQGNTEREDMVNTDSRWVCMRNNSYSPYYQPVKGYYVAGPGEALDAAEYPWGWEQPDYDDSGWKNAAQGMNAKIKGAREYPGPLLVPCPIPPMERTPERFESLRIAEGVQPPADFLRKATRLVVPEHSRVHLLLDHGKLTTGYMNLLFSRGKDADIRIGYAEALYKEKSPYKGDRNDIRNKEFVGYGDRILADGGAGRHFTSLWWRTWRYVDLVVKTEDEPLVIEDVYGDFTAYPFQYASSFSAPGHPELNDVLDVGWHTARLCANETYMDCPYYEQLQYFGDGRIQALVTLFNTRDPYMVKNFIEQGRQSIVGEGITMSRYPTGLYQFISSYSLWWIGMGHDYWMYRGDEAYLKTLLPSFRGVLSWFEQWLKPDMSLDYVPYWFFADWAEGFAEAGEPVRDKNGNSAFQDLMFIMALDWVAEMEAGFGLPELSVRYRNLAASIRKTMRGKYWAEERGLFADTYDHRSFSQHTNSLAVLAGVVKGKEAAEVMQRTLTDTAIIQATVYFRYYVYQALSKAGSGDLYLDNLDTWTSQLDMGLTTWAETGTATSRSDCHAWGSSPNIELYRIVLGIDSDAPGFRKVKIAPALGSLKQVSGSIPHPSGTISAAYKVDRKGRLTADLVLPPGVTGTFVWKGKTYPLVSGPQTLGIENEQ